MHENSSIKRVRYLFVNKVKQTEDPETPRTYSYREYVKQKKVLQVFDRLTGAKVTIEKNAEYKTDQSKSKLLGGTFNAQSARKVFLAHHDLVVPAYLIEVKVKTDIRKFVVDMLYKILNVKRFTKTTKPTETDEEVSMKRLKNYIENELDLNFAAELKHKKEEFDYKMSSILQQISFKLDDITKVNEA